MPELLDTIIRNSGNPVVINVSGAFSDGSPISLSVFNDIEVVFGGETYTLLSDPDQVTVASSDRLELFLGGTSETRSSHFTIKAFNATYPRPEGYTLTNKCLGNLSMPKLCV